MFYTPLDLNDLLEVGLFPPKLTERAGTRFCFWISLVSYMSKRVKWSYGVKTLAHKNHSVPWSWNIYLLLSDLFPNQKVFACESLALLILPEGKRYIDLYKLFTTTAKLFLWKLGCRSKDCFDLYLAYLFNLASDSEKCTSFSVICRAPFIRLFLLLALDLSTFCI